MGTLLLRAVLALTALAGAMGLCDRNLMCHKMRQYMLTLEDSCRANPKCEMPGKVSCLRLESLWSVHGCTAIDCFEVQALGMRGARSSREMCDFWFPSLKYSVLDTATAPKLRKGWVQKESPDGSDPYYENTVSGEKRPDPVWR